MPPGDPLLVRRSTVDDGLALVRQDAAAGSLSVALTYLAPAGTAYDPPGRDGTALMAAELAVVAAGRRDRRALARHLDGLGATLAEHPSPECLEITAWGPTARWEALLELLADVVLRPRFDASDLARSARQMRERQLRERTQPDLRAEIEIMRSVYPPDHPYARTGVGDGKTLARIDAATLRRFHRDHYVLPGSSIIVSGTVPEGPLRKRVRELFGGQGSAPVPPRPELPPVRRPRRRVHRITMPGRTQVEVRVGAPSVARKDPRFAALFLANEVLGGQVLLSRLFQRVREREGLAYSAASDLEAMAWGGFWEAQAGTGPERSAAVEKMVLAEFGRLRDEAIPDVELDRIRESGLGATALEIETTQGAHDLAVSSAYYGFEEDYYRRWPSTLRAIRPGEIRDAVREVLPDEGLALVAVGPARRSGDG